LSDFPKKPTKNAAKTLPGSCRRDTKISCEARADISKNPLPGPRSVLDSQPNRHMLACMAMPRGIAHYYWLTAASPTAFASNAAAKSARV